MIRKISYVIVSVLYFNLFFMFCYYFKIVEFFSDKFLLENRLFDVLVINLFLVAFDVLYILFFSVIKTQKLSYFWYVGSGVFLGVIISFILFKTNNKFSDYLSMVSFFTVNSIFLSYSLMFEKEKNNVFS